jgi:exodeoxyribonuclease III
MKTYDTIQMLRRLAFGATLLTATALLPACDDDPAAPDEELTTDPGTSVQPETLRFISYNILEGMKLDKAQNFDNFVDWVKEKDPDFMALCECNAFTEESLTALAGRYGHPYAILCKESGFPVGLTSKYPIELRNRLLEDVPLWHGAIHTRIKDINVVVLHLYPFGTYPNGQGAAGTGNTYRDREINCILDSTIRRYPVEPLWLMAGDFNSYSPKDADAMPANTYFETHSIVLKSGYCDALRDRHSQFFHTVPTPYNGESTANRRRITSGSTSSTPRRP